MKDTSRLIRTRLLVCGVALLSCHAWAGAIHVARGAPGVLYIDKDGDGYGVASPAGPDADDGDGEVNTPQTVMRKYGSVERFLGHLGYAPGRIHYISPGPDANGRKGLSQWASIRQTLRPGDAVLFRKGTYVEKYVIACSRLAGSSERPILIMAYPGERVVLDGRVASLAVKHSSYLIFDGFVLDHTSGSSQAGINSYDNHHVIYRNLEVMHHYRGWLGMQDLHDVLAENNVFHDNRNSHGVYLGARDRPCSNVTIRNCLIYRSGRHGLQFNGRVKNLLVVGNVIHSNNYGGISLVNGVSDSAIRGNVIFNNNRQGIVFHHGDSLPAYDQTGNIIEDNIIWVGRTSWQGDDGEPTSHAAVEFHDTTAAQVATLAGVVVRNNILTTYRGPMLRSSHPRLVAAATIEDNTIYRLAGESATMRIDRKAYDFAAFENFSNSIRRNSFRKPTFASASVDFFAAPELFDFTLDH